jgi:uncharacterized glyoxalase superfamily protein PhnB
MKIQKITPVLFVDKIEPALPFWQGQLGYEELVSVPLPNSDTKGFVLLARGENQMMLQTRASLKDDLPAIHALAPTSVLYIDVDSLEAAKKATKGSEILVAERTTFYGAKEFAVKDPAGQILIFSEHHR